MAKPKMSPLRAKVREALTGATGGRRPATHDMGEGVVRVMLSRASAEAVVKQLKAAGFVVDDERGWCADVKAGEG